jgi:predicted negative regulator of RcsB-dependent stress response
MKRRTIFIVITGIFIAAIVVSWQMSVRIKKDHEKVESMQKVHELLTRTSIDTTESIGTTLGGLFSDFSFSIGKQRAELFDAKEAIQSQSSIQLECVLHQDLIDFKLKLNQVMKLYHLKEEDCTGQLDTALNNLSYLNRPSWTFTEPRTIDSVLSELNGLDATLSQLEVGILECSQ